MMKKYLRGFSSEVFNEMFEFVLDNVIILAGTISDLEQTGYSKVLKYIFGIRKPT